MPLNPHAISVVNNNDTQSLGYFQTTACLNPITVQFTDRYTGLAYNFLAPCGCCHVCKNSKGNDLFSRIYLDATILKHAYFLTLNFRSYTNKKNIPKELLGMVWQKNTVNYWHSLTYSPLLHDMGVFRKWIQRIKKSKKFRNQTIEYLFCPEYGSKYHRPHAHCIFLCSAPFTIDDFRKSWPYGKIEPSTPTQIREYDDLFTDGSMDFLPTVSAQKSVKYVTKYTTKAHDQINQHKKKFAIQIVADYYQANALPENTLFKPSKHLEQHLAHVLNGKRLTDLSKRLTDPNKLACAALSSVYLPRQTSSRSPSLGSLYASTHLQQLLSRDLKLPTLSVPTTDQAISHGLHSAQHSSAPTLLQPRAYSRIRQKVLNPYVVYKTNDYGYSSTCIPSYSLLVTLMEFIGSVQFPPSVLSSLLLRPSFSVDQTIRVVPIHTYDFPSCPSKYAILAQLLDQYQPTDLPPAYTVGHFYNRSSHEHYTLCAVINVDDFGISTFIGLTFAVSARSGGTPIRYDHTATLLNAIWKQLEDNEDDYRESIDSMQLNSRAYRIARENMPTEYNDNLANIQEAWDILKQTKQHEQETKNPTD